MATVKEKLRAKRKRHIRKRVSGTSERPRLSVYRSARHIYAQLIDDVSGATIAAVSSSGKTPLENSGNVKGAGKVGEMLAEKAKAKKIEKVIFDRNGFKYHGRIKALADAAREKGLKF
jgi:large subunit ribosomal protein L18